MDVDKLIVSHHHLSHRMPASGSLIFSAILSLLQKKTFPEERKSLLFLSSTKNMTARRHDERITFTSVVLNLTLFTFSLS